MKRTMPIKSVPFDLKDDGYPGFVMQVRTNLPVGYLREVTDQMSNGATSKQADAIWLKLFPSWDFVDDAGKAIPHSAKGLEMIPDDLLQAMMARRPEAIQEVVMPAPLESESSKEKEKD